MLVDLNCRMRRQGIIAIGAHVDEAGDRRGITGEGVIQNIYGLGNGVTHGYSPKFYNLLGSPGYRTLPRHGSVRTCLMKFYCYAEMRRRLI